MDEALDVIAETGKDILLKLKETADGAKVVRYWHGKGYAVYVWTVNDRKTMRTLEGMGVYGILTDYPEKRAQALTS